MKKSPDSLPITAYSDGRSRARLGVNALASLNGQGVATLDATRHTDGSVVFDFVEKISGDDGSQSLRSLRFVLPREKAKALVAFVSVGSEPLPDVVSAWVKEVRRVTDHSPEVFAHPSREGCFVVEGAKGAPDRTCTLEEITSDLGYLRTRPSYRLKEFPTYPKD